MPRPRRLLVNPETTPYYHCVSRCVRRAFLCGNDPYSGRCYEHRRQWVVERLNLIASVFCIDVCAYAIMHNHYHLVLRLGNSAHLSDAEVINRWRALFRGPRLIEQYLQEKQLTPPEHQTVLDIIAVWRRRLADLSWFMKCLNEPIARQANAEDSCTGHFWESRYKSQALYTPGALLACMTYVDLNPVRAGITAAPDEYVYTSLHQRLHPSIGRGLDSAVAEYLQRSGAVGEVNALLPFSSRETDDASDAVLPFAFKDYLALIDWTGRRAGPRKQGVIGKGGPSILARFSLERERWLGAALQFEDTYPRSRAQRVVGMWAHKLN